jgi:hypothetical protein
MAVMVVEVASLSGKPAPAFDEPTDASIQRTHRT